MNRTLAAAVLALFAVSARAGVSVGVNQSFGRDDYEGTNLYAAGSFGGFSVAPEYRRYSRKGQTATQSAQIRAGWDSRWFGAGATAGGVFKNAGYSAVFGGADFAFTLSPAGESGIRRIGGPGRAGAPVGKGVSRVDFGGGVLSTAHRQDSAAGGPVVKLTQHELSAFAGASVLGTLFSVRGAKFVYSQDLKTAASLPATRWTPLVGLTPFFNGFADSSVHARAELPALPMIRPHASWTYTSFKELAGGARPGDSRAYGAGLTVGLELLAVEASYQYVDISRGRDSSYASLGASLRF